MKFSSLLKELNEPIFGEKAPISTLAKEEAPPHVKLLYKLNTTRRYA